MEKARHDSKAAFLNRALRYAQDALGNPRNTPNRNLLLKVEVKKVTQLMEDEKKLNKCRVDEIEKGCERGWEEKCRKQLSNDEEGPLEMPDRSHRGEVAKDTRSGSRTPGRVDQRLEKFLRDNNIFCVDMIRSKLMVDRILADKRIEDYNCFYYAKTFVQYAPPIPSPLPPFNTNYGPTENLWEEELIGAGYRGPRVRRASQGQNEFWVEPASTIYTPQNMYRARPGDIIMVIGTPPLTKFTYPYVHSAIITEVDSSGRIVRLRQKIDPFHCVADLSWEQFQALYPGEPRGNYRLWTNPKRAGTLE
jgi:hypothetical protein